MLGVQVMTAQQEGRELLGRGDRAGHASRVHLAPLDLVEHCDVEIPLQLEGGAAPLKLLPHEVATAHDPPGDQPLQRRLDIVRGEPVAFGE